MASNPDPDASCVIGVPVIVEATPCDAAAVSVHDLVSLARNEALRREKSREDRAVQLLAAEHDRLYSLVVDAVRKDCLRSPAGRVRLKVRSHLKDTEYDYTLKTARYLEHRFATEHATNIQVQMYDDASLGDCCVQSWCCCGLPLLYWIPFYVRRRWLGIEYSISIIF